VPSLIPVHQCSSIVDLWPCHTLTGVGSRRRYQIGRAFALSSTWPGGIFGASKAPNKPFPRWDSWHYPNFGDLQRVYGVRSAIFESAAADAAKVGPVANERAASETSTQSMLAFSVRPKSHRSLTVVSTEFAAFSKVSPLTRDNL
jgi:hypothetical protein